MNNNSSDKKSDNLKKEEKEKEALSFPVIPTIRTVMFPNMCMHIDVYKPKSIEALKYAIEKDKKLFVVCQSNYSTDIPVSNDLFKIGVICSIKQVINHPNNKGMRITVYGEQRAKISSVYKEVPFIAVLLDAIDDAKTEECPDSPAYRRIAKKEFETYASYFSDFDRDVLDKVYPIDDNSALVDYICFHSLIDYVDKQIILSDLDPNNRLIALLVMLKKEIANLEVDKEINKKIQASIEENQREYYLREEMKAITEALGEYENPVEEADEYRQRIEQLKCNDEIRLKLLKECDKLMKMPSGSHEATVVRTYIDKCLEIPFGNYTSDSINLTKARKILDKDHYGLEKVKERIVDSLAVYKRNPDFSGQIICLAGPPGVGKTSIVKSLAKCMNREYVRISLGGIHDEAEIRGHRKTYIGSMPGRIAEAVIKSGVMNPVILLDEIDKIGADYKGDPASALLEALDPEQNSTFTDHYIDFPLDLSKVLFITTANDVSTISPPLHNRMEVIELNSYTVQEKFHIAKRHLVKKEMVRHNLDKNSFSITDAALYTLIESYTREAGVRNLQKEIAALCRKTAVAIENGSESLHITNRNIENILGNKKYFKDEINSDNQVGVVNGLAWTSVGGTLLPIEISVMQGSGKLELTGNLGDVMKESAKTAVSYIRSKSDTYGINSDFYETKDIHIHACEGAVPKDGPSAGLAITTALVSELTGIAVKSNVAMTGEISLKGKALPIGGLKEKSMAAYKAGCSTVIIPKKNVKDLTEISSEVKSAVNFIPVSDFDEVVSIALDKPF